MIGNPPVVYLVFNATHPPLLCDPLTPSLEVLPPIVVNVPSPLLDTTTSICSLFPNRTISPYLASVLVMNKPLFCAHV